MPGDALSLREAADELGVTYDWLQRHWRETPGFPRPYIGGGHGQRPRWWRQAVLDFKAGRAFPAGAAPAPPSTVVAIANDPEPLRPSDRVGALLAGLG